MLEGEERVVVGLGARSPAPVELGVHAADRPEQQARLVDQVGAEVQEQSAALGGVAELAPAT